MAFMCLQGGKNRLQSVSRGKEIIQSRQEGLASLSCLRRKRQELFRVEPQSLAAISWSSPFALGDPVHLGQDHQGRHARSPPGTPSSPGPVERADGGRPPGAPPRRGPPVGERYHSTRRFQLSLTGPGALAYPKPGRSTRKNRSFTR